MLQDRPLQPNRPTAEPSSAAVPAAGAILDVLTRLATSGRGLPEVAAPLLDHLAGAAGADAALLLLHDLPPSEAGFRGGADPDLLAPAAGLLQRAVLDGPQPLLIADLSSDRRVPELVLQELLLRGCRSYLCQPLLAGGGLLGSVHLAARRAERFGAAAVERLGLAARVLAVLAQAHRARVEMDRHAEARAREVALLLEVSRCLGDITGRAELPPLVLEALPRIADLDVGVLLLAGEGGGELALLEEVPVPASLRQEAGRAALDEFREVAGRTPPEVRVHETPAASRAPAPPLVPPWRSHLHRPLRRRGEVVGMLSIFAAREAAFREAERRLLTTLAGQVSGTLERLERVLENERSRVESVVDAMGEGLLCLDAAGRVQLTNPAGRRSLLDLVGDPQPSELAHLGEVDLAALLEEFAAGRRTRHQAEVGSGAAGRSYTLTASPVRGRRGGFDGMVIVLSDVTEQRQLREQLLQTEKLSALGEMISGVAHELNNPLAAVMGLSQLLETAPDLDDRVRRKVQGINREAARCQRIVQSLLSFARNHHPRKEPVDLNSVVRALLQLMEYPLRADGVEVIANLSPDLPAVLGDAHQLQQVLLNLVTNANHAMRGTGRPGRLQILSRPCDDRVTLLVEDNGAGIRSEHLRRVFDPFFTTKKVGRGTGLGLSLAYGCVQEHGGEIRVDSKPGEWTRFSIELPACPTHVPAAAPAKPAAAGPRPDLPGHDILVVDDEPAITEFIAEALTVDGHRVRVVHDGLQARRCLEERSYDLIITDLKMPQMNGRELYEDLLSRSPEMASRVIFSTGDTVNRDTADFLRQIGDRYLTKPFRLTELQAMVDRVLSPGP